MTPSRVTPAQIAQVSGLTEKHVRRMVGRAQGAGPHVSPCWFGERMRVRVVESGLEVEFASLPQHIREAFVLLDQPDLPLPPPRSRINCNRMTHELRARHHAYA